MYTLLQSLPYPAHVVDDKLNVIAWNHGAECTFGPSAREALGRPCPELVRTAEPALWAQRIATLRQTGFLACRSRVLNRDGLLVVVDVLSVARKGRAGMEFLSVLRDVSIENGQTGAGAAHVQRRSSRQAPRYVERCAAMTETAKQHRRRVVATNLRRIRLSRELSQEQLAHRLEIRREHVNRWENQVWEPSVEYIDQLAEVLDVGVYEFYLEPESEAASA